MSISISAIARVCLIAVLIWVSIYDIKYRKIENYIHPIIIFIGLFINVNSSGLAERLIGALFCFLPIFIVNVIFGGIGMGDAKLMASFGFILGVYKGMSCLIIGLFLISIFGAAVYILKRNKSPIPFAPFLCIGLIISMLL